MFNYGYAQTYYGPIVTWYAPKLRKWSGVYECNESIRIWILNPADMGDA